MRFFLLFFVFIIILMSYRNYDENDYIQKLYGNQQPQRQMQNQQPQRQIQNQQPQRQMQNQQPQRQMQNHVPPVYQQRPVQQQRQDVQNRGQGQENFQMPVPDRNPNMNQKPLPKQDKFNNLSPHEKEIKEFGMGMMSSLDRISGFGSSNNVQCVTNEQFNIGLCGNILPIDNKLSCS